MAYCSSPALTPDTQLRQENFARRGRSSLLQVLMAPGALS